MTMINRSLSDQVTIFVVVNEKERKEDFFQQSSEITNAEFRIHRCSYSYIYILAPLRYSLVSLAHSFANSFSSLDVSKFVNVTM